MAEMEQDNLRENFESDEELVTRACSGCATALEDLLSRLEVPLRQTLNGLIPAAYRSAFDLDDVIQVTFIEAFLRIGQFSPRGPKSFLAWLGTLARNNLRDAVKELRAEKRIPRHRMVSAGGGSDSHEGLLAALAGSATSPSGGAARTEAKACVEEALGKLPPDYAKVVCFVDLEGHTGRSAAKAMGRSIGAVYMLRVRAHERLRELLGSGSNFFSGGA